MLSSGRSRTVSLGEEGAAGLERMEMEEVGVSVDFEYQHFQNLGIALLPHGSPFGDPGDLFQFLGPHWLPLGPHFLF